MNKEIEFYPIFIALLFLSLAYFPIIFILTISYIMVYNKKLNNNFIFIYILLIFSFIFYLRLYGGLTSINGSRDDAIHYLGIFSILKDSGYLDFFEQAANHGATSLEPAYWLIFYIIGLFSNFSTDIFVFFNYLLPLFLFLYFLKKIFKEKYLLGFLFITTFGYQYFYALVFSIWRQSLAFAIILMGLYFLSINRKSTTFLLLVMAFFIHFSSILFLSIYMMFLLVSSKIKLSYLILSLSFLTILSLYILQSYGVLFEEKFSVYTSGTHMLSGTRINSIVKFVGAILISSILFWKSHNLNDQFLKIISFFSLIGNIFIILTMNYGTINTRMQLSINILFLIMTYYFITKYYDYNKQIYIFIFFIILVLFIKLTQDTTFFSMFLLDGNFNEAFIYSLGDFYSLFDTERGFK